MGNTARVGWVAITWAASALAGVALGGCASSGEPVGGRQGIIRGQAELSGRVPFAGHSFEVGAISGGKVVKTASVFSPPPPIMRYGRGRCRFCGELRVRPSW
jgi:hypothetical protein